MNKLYVGQQKIIRFIFQPFQAGLTDVKLDVFNENDALEVSLSMNEGLDGIYKAAYTPTTEGDKTVMISSPTVGRVHYESYQVVDVDFEELIKEIYRSIYRKRVWNGTNTITVFDKSGAVVDKTFNTDGDLSEISPGNFTPKI